MGPEVEVQTIDFPSFTVRTAPVYRRRTSAGSATTA